MATLAITIDGTTRLPLAAGTSIVLEQRRPSGTLVINDLNSDITIDILDVVTVAAGGSNLFSGYVLAVRKARGRLRDGQRRLELECVGKSWRTAHPPALISKSYSSETDQDIAIDLVAEAGLDSLFTATTSTVDQTKTGITTAFGPRATLEEALDQLADITGARWYIDADDTLHWNADASAAAAPWDVNVDAPNGTTTFDVIQLWFAERIDEIGNKIEVVGGQDAGTVRASAEDATSIAAYGAFIRAFEDVAWVNQSTVDEIAAAALASYKDPSFDFGFSTRRDGLAPNQLIDLTAADFNLSAKAGVVRRVEMIQQKDDITLYRILGGNRPKSIETLLRRLQSRGASAGLSSELVRGLDFTASSSEHVDTGTSIANIDDMTEFSFRLTLAPDDVTNTLRLLFSKMNGSQQGWSVTCNPSNGLFGVKRTKDIGDLNWSRVGGALSSGKLYTIVAVVKAATVDLWLDGVEMLTGGGQSGGSGSLHSEASSALQAARQSGGTFNYWDGMLANLAIWDLALPDTTAAMVHQASIDNLPFSSNLQFVWKMDEFVAGDPATGTDSILDRSGNNYHGTPTNTPTSIEKTLIDS